MTMQQRVEEHEEDLLGTSYPQEKLGKTKDIRRKFPLLAQLKDAYTQRTAKQWRLRIIKERTKLSQKQK